MPAIGFMLVTVDIKIPVLPEVVYLSICFIKVIYVLSELAIL